MKSMLTSIKKLDNLFDRVRDHKFLIIIFSIVFLLFLYFVWALEQPSGSDNAFLVFWNESLRMKLWQVSFVLLLFILGLSRTFKYDALLKRHKARIRLLERFAPRTRFSGLIGDKSIYNSVIAMFQRAKDESARGDVSIKLLLCSPALDYPGRMKDANGNNKFSEWGSEFQEVLGEIIAKPNAEVEIHYLPDEEISGFNTLKGFLETLSNYCANNGVKIASAEQIFQQIELRTNHIQTLLKSYDKDDLKHLTVNRTKILDIPFQIFISSSKNLKEVIVSFAGKEILEDEDAPDPKGFHSMDADVVEAFEEIYKNYVSEHKRLPLKPRHTLSIIQEQEEKKQHDIFNFLDCIPKLTVNKGIFSPAVANSSKFTSYVLIKIIEKENTILDIGSGTGVQAIVAYNHLMKLNKDLVDPTPNVWAIEAVEEAFENLKLNCDPLDIEIRNWELLSKVELSEDTTKLVPCNDLHRGKPHYGSKIIDGVFRKKLAGDTAEFVAIPDDEKNGFGHFDLVVADLPYVDTLPDNALERAFFDTDHNAHKTLLLMISHCDWLKPEGILITSFSTLGGLEDLAKFERIISDCDLHTVQRFSFSEQGYLWMVYCIVRENSFNPKTYWWKKLNAKQFSE